MSTTATVEACRPGIGFCAPGEAPSEPLTGRQRAGRAAAGAALLAAAAGAARFRNVTTAALTATVGWVGVSHLVAAATRYNGCPELGAIPSVLLGRHVHTRCGPWQTLDARLGLAGREPAHA